MAVPIPEYLKNIARIAKAKSDYVVIDIVCECGCLEFEVYQNKSNLDDEKKWKEWEQKLSKWGVVEGGYIDKNDGKRYIVRRNFLGKIVEKISESEIPKLNKHTIIKVKCDKCGRTYTVFDNKKYGYDAFVTEEKSDNIPPEFVQKKFRASERNALKIAIKIFNDESLKSFVERTGESQTNYEHYSDAFSGITIYGCIIDLNNKKTTIFAEETA